MKKKVINVGVVGCGYWGPNLIRNFRALQDCRMKVICDQDPARLKQLKSLYPEVQTETDFNKVIADKSIDALIIATPVRFHYKMAKASLEAGKHTFIEKPMASSSAECEELNAIAERNNLTLMIGHTFLYSSSVRKIKEIVQSGDIGTPVRMGFVDPAGRSTGHLFPTGRERDRLSDAVGAVTVTLVDAGAPVVAVRAADVGVRGDEDIAVLDAVPGLLARLDAVRREAGVRMGLAETPEAVARAVPKLALVSGAVSDDAPETDLTVRMLSMGRFHPAVPVTGSVALTLAAGAAGTVVHDLVAPTSPVDGLRLATPAGCVSTFVEDHEGVPVVGVVRTYRRLASGSVLLPDPPLQPSASA